MICLLNMMLQSGLDLNVERQTQGFCGSSPKTVAHEGNLVFAQLMLYLPPSTFRRCVADYRSEHKVKDFSCLDRFFAMAFAQLTYRESLRDNEATLRAQARRRYHMGFEDGVYDKLRQAMCRCSLMWAALRQLLRP